MGTAEGGRNAEVGAGGNQSAATGRQGKSEPQPHPQGLRSGPVTSWQGVGEGGQRHGTRRRQAQDQTLANVTRTETGRVEGKGPLQDLSRKNLADSDLSPFKHSHKRPQQGRAFGNGGSPLAPAAALSLTFSFPSCS